MNIYETIKAAVTVKQAAEHYGLQVHRSEMCCCPFHDDRHPSMKLNEDYFYCFGCQATGDVIDLTARLFGIGSYEAAQKLAADFGVEIGQQPSIRAKLKQPKPYVQQFKEDELRCMKVLVEYLHLLEDWKVRFAPKMPDDKTDDRFVEACHKYEYISYLTDILAVGELEERVKTVEMLMKDGIISGLRDRLNRLKKEERQNGKAKEAEIA